MQTNTDWELFEETIARNVGHEQSMFSFSFHHNIAPLLDGYQLRRKESFQTGLASLLMDASSSSSTENGAAAQFVVGWLHSIGAAVEQDDTKAMEWLQKAAQRGYPAAQFYLGYLYDEVVEAIQDRYVKAIEWYTKAADHGHPAAQCALGDMYSKDK